ncbi:hypothetical protein [Streptomyces lonegramiae]|uniref:TIGR03750 family conjugal transfer protein n=1 Tax=Streptomyces lonegramiae TaxID=3075524 RepID=A0ABU2X9Q9_9ACTN|nr:hypothetical protein [Streptomyces sp. DSM 41529]MDT0542641.1 hypothetical protein [Streptomyces sp. DSM 41529]
MRWKDESGTKWRLRQQRLAWPRRVKPEAAFEHAPNLGDDPISGIIALPFLLVFVVLLPFWLAELLLRLLLAPLVAVLRLAGVVPYRLKLYKAGRRTGSYSAHGLGELVRLRWQLAETWGRPGGGR